MFYNSPRSCLMMDKCQSLSRSRHLQHSLHNEQSLMNFWQPVLEPVSSVETIFFYLRFVTFTYCNAKTKFSSILYFVQQLLTDGFYSVDQSNKKTLRTISLTIKYLNMIEANYQELSSSNAWIKECCIRFLDAITASVQFNTALPVCSKNHLFSNNYLSFEIKN